MISKKQYDEAQQKAWKYFEKAGIVLTDSEKFAIEVADFGLGDLDKIGLEVLMVRIFLPIPESTGLQRWCRGDHWSLLK